MDIGSLHIWIFNHYAIPPDQSGGTRHFDLAKQLVKKGHLVTIFAAGFNHYTNVEFIDFKAESIVQNEVDGVRFCWFKTPHYSKNDWRRVRNMMAFTWNSLQQGKRMEKPDIIIGSSVHLFAVWTAFRLAKYFSVSFVMEVRDIWPQTLIDMGMNPNHPFIKLLAYLEKKLYRAADHIITLLPNAAAHIQQFGVNPERITWISNGVNIGEHPPAREATDTSKLQVKYVGAIGLANNLDVLLEAAEKMKNKPVFFEVYGAGPMKDDLVEKASQLGLHNIQFPGTVPKHEVQGILRKADVLYVGLKDLPLYRFGISFNKIFDYMAAAKPIIFACKTFNDPVKDAGCGMTIQPDHTEELVSAIEAFLKMPHEEREAMGLRGFNYARTNFSTRILSEKLLTLLTDTIRKHH